MATADLMARFVTVSLNKVHGSDPAHPTAHNATRRDIAEAALKLFIRDGYESVGVDAIVARAGHLRPDLPPVYGEPSEVRRAWTPAATPRVTAAAAPAAVV